MQNILIISPFYIPFAGVGANRMKSFIESLRKDSSFNIFVLKTSTESYGDSIIDEDYPEGITVIESGAPRGFMDGASLYKKSVEDIFAKYQIDMVLISMGPFFTLPLVSMIKKKYKVPVIMDIRDFWAHEPVTKDLQSGVIPKIKTFVKDAFFERKAIFAAHKIVVTGEDEKVFLSKVYGERIKAKTFAIPNGFDDIVLSDICKARGRSMSGSLNLCVYGKFSEYISDNRLREFSRGLKYFGEKEAPVNFIQIGREEPKLKAFLEEEELNFDGKGYMEYKEGIQTLQATSDILVLSSDLESFGLGTKVYDYIYCNKPMLYMGSKETALAKFVATFQNGFVCSNSEEVFQALLKVYSQKLDYLDNNVDVNTYSRSIQNKKYIQLIKENNCKE